MSLFDIPKLKHQIEDLHKQTMQTNFWNDAKHSAGILFKLKNMEKKVSSYEKIETDLNNLLELTVLLTEDPDDSMAKEVLKSTSKIEKALDALALETLLNGKYDTNNAIVTIHPGAGGTESQDWAEMLYRMYAKWANANGFSIKELNFLEGEEAGIKSVTFVVEGQNAYGYLKCEKGVHRLVRISPFDSGGRRHTSFASVEVMPEITEDITIEINPTDLRIDTYRASRSRWPTY